MIYWGRALEDGYRAIETYPTSISYCIRRRRRGPSQTGQVPERINVNHTGRHWQGPGTVWERNWELSEQTEAKVHQGIWKSVYSSMNQVLDRRGQKQEKESIIGWHREILQTYCLLQSNQALIRAYSYYI